MDRIDWSNPPQYTSRSTPYAIRAYKMGGAFPTIAVYDKKGDIYRTVLVENYDQNGIPTPSSEAKAIAEAVKYVEKLKRKDGVQSTHTTQTAHATSAPKSSSPNLGSVTPDPGLNPLAFEVAGFGSDTDGFVVFDENGTLDRTFDKKKDAQKYADSIRATYQARQKQAANSSPTPITPPSPRGTSATQPSMPPGNGAAAQASAIGSVSSPSPRSSPATGTSSTSPFVPPPAARARGSSTSFTSTARGTNSTGLSPWAAAFDQAFDRSIGKAISGATKIVTSSMNAFRQGYSGIKSAVANPAGTASAFATSASRAAFSAQIVSAFAVARSKGFMGSTVAGVSSGFGTAFNTTATPPKPGKRSSGRASRVAARAAVARSRRGTAATTYRSARRAGATQWRARGVASAAVRAERYAAIAGSVGSAGLMTTALLAIPKVLHAFSEIQLNQNRRLAPYSGTISAGFTQLALGDQYRDMRLAQSAERTAGTLARQVNGIREGITGLDILTTGLGNRLGIAASALVAPGIREAGKLADDAAKWLNIKDPNGDAVVGLINAGHDWLAGIAGGIAGQLPGGAGWAAGQADAIKQAQRDRNAANQLQSDIWTNFMQGAQNLPKLQPARPVRI